MTDDRWPTAALGEVGRMRVLAAAFPGAFLEERLVPRSFETVWGYLSDLERSIPDFDRTVGGLRIVRRDGERLEARARAAGPVPLATTFDVDLRPGWCWMVARPAFYVVGFAAEPEGDQTRLAHMEALSVPGPPGLRAALGPLLRMSRFGVARHVPRDLDGIGRALGA